MSWSESASRNAASLGLPHAGGCGNASRTTDRGAGGLGDSTHH